MKNKIFTLKDRTLSVDLSEIEYIYLDDNDAWQVKFRSTNGIEILDVREAHKVQAAWEAYNEQAAGVGFCYTCMNRCDSDDEEPCLTCDGGIHWRPKPIG